MRAVSSACIRQLPSRPGEIANACLLRCLRIESEIQNGLVPLAGIEPALLAELDFESSASTNSATGALSGRFAGWRRSQSRRNIAGAPTRSTRLPGMRQGVAGAGKSAANRAFPPPPRRDAGQPRQRPARKIRTSPREIRVTTTAANQSPARDASGSAPMAAAAIALVAAATLAGAWFFQLVLDILPCPLCLEQRYAYYLMVPLGLVLAFASAKGAPRAVVVAGFVALALAALGNAWLGGYHAGVEWHFWRGPTDCTGPVGNLGSAGDLLARLDTVKVIRCDEVQWRFLGLSLAGYNVLISLLLAALAVWGLKSARRL